MPRIKLAFWHGKHQPGDELDVTDDELAALRRDGRVAEVLEDTQTAAEPAAEAQPRPVEEEVPEQESAVSGDAPSGRKRR